MNIVLKVEGIPKPQPRPRAFARKMGDGKYSARIYDAGTAEAWKSSIAAVAYQHKPPALLAGPIKVELQFRMPRPKSHHISANRDRPLKATAPEWPTGKPDCDNLAKAVLDCLTQLGGFWKDDSQVCGLLISKAYETVSKPPGVTVVIAGLVTQCNAM